jgi:hypothetical protein
VTTNKKTKSICFWALVLSQRNHPSLLRMPQGAKHDSYAEFMERKSFPNSNFSRAATPNW